jgi:flagellar biosynthesis chaperone FliJ
MSETRSFEDVYRVQTARIEELEREVADLRRRLEEAEADARHVRQANENYRKENAIAVAELATAEARMVERCIRIFESENKKQSDGRCCDNCNCMAIKKGMAAIRALLPKGESNGQG